MTRRRFVFRMNIKLENDAQGTGLGLKGPVCILSAMALQVAWLVGVAPNLFGATRPTPGLWLGRAHQRLWARRRPWCIAPPA